MISTYLPTEQSLFNANSFSEKAAFYCALSFAFFIPISPALMNTFLLLCLIFILFTGNAKEHLIIAWNNPIARYAALFFCLFLTGSIWSIAEFKETLEGLKKYNELWYIALLVPLFHSPERRQQGINILLASLTTILLLTYLIYFNIIPEIEINIADKNYSTITIDGGFKTHIITNILMSFATFVFAHRALLKSGKKKFIYFLLFIAAFYYAIFISTGTTGQILTLSLICLLIIQHFKGKSILIIPASIILIFGYGYANKSTSIHHAIEKINGGIEHDGGSASHRREYLENGIYLIKEQPWIGSGTGSITKRYAQIPEDKILTGLTDNPHNEYIAIGLQLGIIGILGLLLLFFLQIKYSFKIENKEERFLAQGISSLIIVGCLGNSLIMDSGEGHFWAYFSAILFSTIQQQNKEKCLQSA